MSAFFRLSNRLQQGIAHTLGWDELRPVQELTIEAVLDGKNCIVLAPTAGGKTEAAFFPILDTVYNEKLPPVSTLYIIAIGRGYPDPAEMAIEVSEDFHYYGDNSYALLDAWEGREELMAALEAALITRARRPASQEVGLLLA